MDGFSLDIRAIIWELQNLLLLVVGVVFPLLLLARSGEAKGIPWLSVEALAYAVYVGCAVAYGREVLVAGGWACVAFGAVLIARVAYRGRPRGGDRPDEEAPTPR